MEKTGNTISSKLHAFVLKAPFLRSLKLRIFLITFLFGMIPVYHISFRDDSRIYHEIRDPVEL